MQNLNTTRSDLPADANGKINWESIFKVVAVAAIKKFSADQMLQIGRISKIDKEMLEAENKIIYEIQKTSPAEANGLL